MSREYTRKMIDVITQGEADPQDILFSLLGYLSEAEVKEFYEHCIFEGTIPDDREYFEEDEDEDED